ncbi:MAG: hypothetical protein M3295_01480 [Chloroflexota bacterium]|nr:hypothetical protein [Chloroflexota bacterium]
MTTQRNDFERRVADWLETDGPDVAPDELMESTLAQIGTVRQRHGRYSATLVGGLAAAAVIVLALVATLAVFGGRNLGSNNVPSPGATETPQASIGPESSSGDRCQADEPACGEPLTPGVRYTTAHFRPQVGFMAPDAHWIAARDEPSHFLLWMEADNRRRIGLYLNPRPAEPDGTLIDGVGTSADDLAAWLGTNRDLAVRDARSVALLGLSGRSVDVRINPATTAHAADVCVEFEEFPCVVFLAAPATGSPYELGISSFSRFRLQLFDLPGGGTLMVTLEAHHNADFDVLADRGRPLLESLTLTSS